MAAVYFRCGSFLNSGIYLVNVTLDTGKQAAQSVRVFYNGSPYQVPPGTFLFFLSLEMCWLE